MPPQKGLPAHFWATYRPRSAGQIAFPLRFGLLFGPRPPRTANLDPKSLEFTGIDPYHPLRLAQPEDQALGHAFRPVRSALKKYECTRAVLVGHNAHFDLAFLNAAVERTGIKRNPFHPFSCFDTASLGGLAYGQTVLARACKSAGIEFDGHEAHSARYDTARTADLFCAIVNRWKDLGGWPPSSDEA